MENWRNWARELKSEALVLYLASRHPKTPFFAKIIVGIVVAYAFSPIDLIPDFIPILGYLDDLLLLPIGIALALYLIPTDVIEECREQAKTLIERPLNGWMKVVIFCIWAFAILLCIRILWVWLN